MVVVPNVGTAVFILYQYGGRFQVIIKIDYVILLKYLSINQVAHTFHCTNCSLLHVGLFVKMRLLL